MNPKHHVSDVLDLLSGRLDPIIQGRLAGVLKCLDWTVILSELDKAKGYPPKSYSRGDIQSQLRMLTEPLGGLGYPFSDKERVASTLGGELRIVRNAFAHGGDLTWLDAWRAADFGVRLLAYFGDSEGESRLAAKRDAILPALATERGLSLDSATAEAAALVSADLAAAEAVEVTLPLAGSPKVVSPGSPPPTGKVPESLPGLGGERPRFSPWQVVIAGPREVIDELPKKVAKLQVRAVATEIVEYEGPVQIERLARLTAASFGWSRLPLKRVKQIAYQIRQIDGITVDEHGFAWPTELHPGVWAGFRPQSSTSDRAIHEISPYEIANAIRLVRGTHPGLSDDELRREVISIFGRSKLTVGAQEVLNRALEIAAS